MEQRLSWNQPCCESCWNKREPNRVAVRLNQRHVTIERCSFCGEGTVSGIYVRHDPKDVLYPAMEWV